MATVLSDRTSLRWPPRRQLLGLLGIAILGSATLSAISSWRDQHLFLINASGSLPNWAFLIRRGAAPRRGDFIFFDPPRSALLTRHFGMKPQMFGKIVYGASGDIIAHSGDMVTINGRPVGQMKSRTSRNEPLTPGAVGVVPPNCFYVGTPHRDGFDSRYAEIGFVCRPQIIGVGESVL